MSNSRNHRATISLAPLRPLSQFPPEGDAPVALPAEGDACRSSTKQRRLSQFHQQRQRGGVTRHCFDGFPTGGYAALALAAGKAGLCT